MTNTITAKHIKEFLGRHYATEPYRYIFLTEVRPGTGGDHDSDRYIDAWSIACAKTENWIRTAYEIKVSRSDWLSELKQPLKRRMGLMLSNEFYFIAPRGIIKVDEVPAQCGLIEVLYATADNARDIVKEAYSCHKRPMWPDDRQGLSLPKGEQFLVGITVIPAPWRDSPPPTWKFMASTLRRLITRPESGSLAEIDKMRAMLDKATDVMELLLEPHDTSTGKWDARTFIHDWQKYKEKHGR